MLYGQGDRCRGAFIIRSGLCQMSILADNGSVVYHRLLGRDCILGLPATLCDHEYSATAVALEGSDLAWIDTSSFQEFVRSRPDLSITIVSMMSREVTEMNLRRANIESCRACGCSLAEACSHHFPNP
jgi:CRP-like cAMP-binding protein